MRLSRAAEAGHELAAGALPTHDVSEADLPIEEHSRGRSLWLYAAATTTAIATILAISTTLWFPSQPTEESNAVAMAASSNSAEPDELPSAESSIADSDAATAGPAPVATSVPESSSAVKPSAPAVLPETPEPADAPEVASLKPTDRDMTVADAGSLQEPAGTLDEQQPTTENTATLDSPVANDPAAGTLAATEDPDQALRPVPQLERTPPPDVDIEQRLADPIPEMVFPPMTLGRFVSVMSRLSTIPMSFDAEALSDLRITTDAKVTVELKDTTVGEALTSILAQQKLTYVVEPRQLLITLPQTAQTSLRRVRYDIADLLDEQPNSIRTFAELVQRLVLPESWSLIGGIGQLEIDGSALIVHHDARAHWHVLSFCEKLRLARGRVVRGSFPPDRFPLASRYARARESMQRPITVNFAVPAPLTTIATRVAEQANTTVLIDGRALAEANLASATDAFLVADQLPMEAALRQLTAPLGLASRLVDGAIVEITTPTELARRFELEFYPAADLITERITGSEIAHRIEQRLAASSWRSNGGTAEIYFDAPSGHLLVLQSQDVQVRVEKLLGQWRAAAEVAIR